MKSAILKPVLGFIFLVFLVSILSYLFFFLRNDLDIIDDENLIWGIGWERNKSHYSGSEMRFTIRNTSKVSFKINTSSKATQGVEINIEDEKYVLSSPNLNSQQLTIHLDKKNSYVVNIRHFCTYFYEPCEITIESITIDHGAKLYAEEIDKKVISILGDSISTIYGRDNYSFLLANSLGYQLHNASILGSTLAKNKDSDNAIERYEADLKGINSDVTVVFLGSNDATNNISHDTFENDYSTIVKDVKKWNPDGKIFLVGLLPREDIETVHLNNYTNVIRNISSKYGTHFIDVNGWLTEEDFSDDIHPSIQSQPRLAEKFREIILRTLE